MIVDMHHSIASSPTCRLGRAEGVKVTCYVERAANVPRMSHNVPAERFAWSNAKDLSQLTSWPVRIRFVLKDAELFSLRFE